MPKEICPQERVEFLEKLPLNGNIFKKAKNVLHIFLLLGIQVSNQKKLSNFCQRRFAQYSWIFNHKEISEIDEVSCSKIEGYTAKGHLPLRLSLALYHYQVTREMSFCYHIISFEPATIWLVSASFNLLQYEKKMKITKEWD